MRCEWSNPTDLQTRTSSYVLSQIPTSSHDTDFLPGKYSSGYVILPMVRCVWRVTICGAASWCTRSCRLPLGRVIRQPTWGEGAPFTHNKKKATESEEPDLKPPPLKGGLLWKVWEVVWGQMVVITHFHRTARPQY